MNIQAAEKAREIVRMAGGRISGRTRLQKIAYLLEVAGHPTGFKFEYKHYGPYSEDLASGARVAHILEMLNEREQPAQWGGTYSIYTAEGNSPAVSDGLRLLVQEAAISDSIELELAATALFLARQNVADPWAETMRRKPEKASGGRLNRAKHLYSRLSGLQTPKPLPPI